MPNGNLDRAPPAEESGSEGRFRALAENATVAIFVIDQESTIVFVNRAAEKIFGYSVEELMGRSLDMLMPRDQRPRHDAGVRNYLATGRRNIPWEGVELPGLARDGRVIPLEISMGEFTRGGRRYFTGIARDITERKKAESALRESEERFRTLGNSIPQLVWIADTDGRTFWYNDRWYEYTGSTSAVMEGWGWQKLLHPEHEERVVGGFQRAFETGEPWEDTYPLRSRTGEYRWFLSRMRPIRDESGTIVRWFGTNTDVTERMEAAAERERLLEAAQEAHGKADRRAREEQALREAAGALSASATTEEVIRQIAQSAITATNADAAFVERIDITVGEVVVVATAGGTLPTVGARAAYSGSFAEHVVEGAEPVIVPRLSDATFHLPGDLAHSCPSAAALALPLVDGGEPVGALILLRGPAKQEFRPDEIRRALTFADLAALAFRRIHMLEDSEQRREELQRVMESRARLMRGFSHDVKNPLGAADGFLALLEEGVVGELSEKQREHIDRARRSIGSSLNLIDDLLELARAEAGQIDIEREPVDVRDAVRELGEEYRAQAEAKGLEMKIMVADEFPVIESDANRVRQILGNLFSNAVKYTDEGQVRVTVEVRSGDGSRSGEWVTTEVKDTGPGIPEDKQVLLFQEFTRLDPGEKKGAGVGLAISQRIAHALGGEITASSEAGSGSAFTLWLPCTRGESAGGVKGVSPS